MPLYLHNEKETRISTGDDRVALSRIFEWYGEDFGTTDAYLQLFLAPYFEGDLRDRHANGAFEVDDLPYDWTVNDQAAGSTDPPDE